MRRGASDSKRIADESIIKEMPSDSRFNVSHMVGNFITEKNLDD